MIEELEQFLKRQAKKITDYLFEAVEKIVSRKSDLDIYEAIGMIPENRLLKAFDLKYNTLAKWREHGLTRYKPHDESRKYFYKTQEIIDFMKEAED